MQRIRRESDKKKEPEQYKIVVKLRREGETVFPVEVRMTLDSGEVIGRQWDGRDRWVKYEFTKASRVKRVEIDPEVKLHSLSSRSEYSLQASPKISLSTRTTMVLAEDWISDII